MLLVDIGNTQVKWGISDEKGEIVAHGRLGAQGWKDVDGLKNESKAMVSASGAACAKHCATLKALGIEPTILNSRLKLPITIDYATPETLGPDRIAAACGAYRAARGECVIIDAGTCITVDYVNRLGFYRGGAIVPGVNVALQAMCHGTAHLPLVRWERNEPCHQLGYTTHEAILSGALWGTRYAVQGFINHYRKLHRDIPIYATGGDAEQLIINHDEVIFEPLLVLKGMASIQ